MILKPFNKNKKENNKLNNNKNEKNNNIAFNRNNIIRIITSNEKATHNFPIEYLNEMISDICLNLYNIDYNLEIIKYRQSPYFNNYHNFFRY